MSFFFDEERTKCLNESISPENIQGIRNHELIEKLLHHGSLRASELILNTGVKHGVPLVCFQGSKHAGAVLVPPLR